MEYAAKPYVAPQPQRGIDSANASAPMSEEPLAIWTIGHSNRELSEFLELLHVNGIEAIADLRRFQGSRKHPHFGQASLQESLAKVGVEYASLPELGGRRKPRPDSLNTVWRNESFRGYADYMETAEFPAGLERLLGLARRKRTAILCAEAVWWRCHRSMIADALKARGVIVRHIINLTKTEEHPYTAAARLRHGRLTYAPEGQPARRPQTKPGKRVPAAKSKPPRGTVMKKRFQIGDHVSWNSEAGHVSGTIVGVHTADFDYKGYTHHASEDDPQYEIQSDKTDHLAVHKGSALKKLVR